MWASLWLALIPWTHAKNYGWFGLVVLSTGLSKLVVGDELHHSIPRWSNRRARSRVEQLTPQRQRVCCHFPLGRWCGVFGLAGHVKSGVDGYSSGVCAVVM